MPRKTSVEGKRRTRTDKAREHYERTGKYGRSKIDSMFLAEKQEFSARPVGKQKVHKAKPVTVDDESW